MADYPTRRRTLRVRASSHHGFGGRAAAVVDGSDLDPVVGAGSAALVVPEALGGSLDDGVDGVGSGPLEEVHPPDAIPGPAVGGIAEIELDAERRVSLSPEGSCPSPSPHRTRLEVHREVPALVACLVEHRPVPGPSFEVMLRDEFVWRSRTPWVSSSFRTSRYRRSRQHPA